MSADPAKSERGALRIRTRFSVSAVRAQSARFRQVGSVFAHPETSVAICELSDVARAVAGSGADPSGHSPHPGSLGPSE